MDKKCAANVKYEDGSCISTDLLKKIATNFNNNSNSIKINTSNDKKELVDDLENAFNKKYGCDNQLCWLNQNFVKRMNNAELQKFTFKPMGPSKKFDWLSTTNINDVIEQYERKYKNFLFLGAVPYDFQELRQLEMGEMSFDDSP